MIASRYFVAIATLALVATTASAAEGFSVKALLMQALDAPDGEAKGVVAGKEADAIHAATGASDPVRAEVSTIKKFNQEGCSRLAVRLVQPNTPTKEGGKADFALNYELNLCRNGMPPSEGIDLGRAAKILGN
jgi:hypothetical protein